jgi:hypothetical protein
MEKGKWNILTEIADLGPWYIAFLTFKVGFHEKKSRISC